MVAIFGSCRSCNARPAEENHRRHGRAVQRKLRDRRAGDVACKLGLKGVVSKVCGGNYPSGRSKDWVNDHGAVNRDCIGPHFHYEQVKRRQRGNDREGEGRSSKLVGLNVYNDANEKIGDINDAILDKSGKVESVILGVGGFLGMGEHYVTVGYNKLKWSNKPPRSTMARDAVF
jgi:sporulation protein YlmC with PRC-barrel domain